MSSSSVRLSRWLGCTLCLTAGLAFSEIGLFSLVTATSGIARTFQRSELEVVSREEREVVSVYWRWCCRCLRRKGGPGGGLTRGQSLSNLAASSWSGMRRSVSPRAAALEFGQSLSVEEEELSDLL